MAATPSLAETSAKHTPGPWRLSEPNGLMVIAPNDDVICGMEVWDFTAIMFANARLIAAAPRLLDALRGLVGLIQLIQAREPDLQTNHRYVEALAAMTEAEGVNSSQA